MKSIGAFLLFFTLAFSVSSAHTSAKEQAKRSKPSTSEATQLGKLRNEITLSLVPISEIPAERRFISEDIFKLAVVVRNRAAIIPYPVDFLSLLAEYVRHAVTPTSLDHLLSKSRLQEYVDEVYKVSLEAASFGVFRDANAGEYLRVGVW